MAGLNPRRRSALINPELGAELHEALVECRRTTRLFDAQVGQKCGVEAKTLQRWLTMGLMPDAQEPYLSFARDYSDASIDVENDALEEIRAGEEGKPGQRSNWKSTAWWLERWKPTRWGGKVPEGGPVESIDIQRLVEDAGHRVQTLSELFQEPPAELEAAMKQNRESILALLTAPELEEPKG